MGASFSSVTEQAQGMFAVTSRAMLVGRNKLKPSVHAVPRK
jgi:hypothetical protein